MRLGLARTACNWLYNGICRGCVSAHLMDTMKSLSAAPAAFDDAMRNLRIQIDDHLQALLPAPCNAGDLMAAALRDGVLAPGKRFRPLLMLLTGQGMKCQSPALLDLACAVEMVHTASLFLDDMPCMDNAQLRRGRVAIHVRYGEDVAVLGAVALLSQAWRIVASTQALDAATRNQLTVVLSDAVGVQGLVRGQYRDLREGAARRTPEDIAQANQQKTGVLFGAVLEMAALTAGATAASRASLQQAAFELGQAFQLRDDLDDSAPATAARTKDAFKDVGKSTLVAVLGPGAARQRVAGHLARAETHFEQALAEPAGVLALVRGAFAKGPAAQSSQPSRRKAVAPHEARAAASLRFS